MQNTKESESLIAWLPALLFTGRKFESGLALVSDNAGAIVKIVRADELTGEQKMRLSNRAVLPGMVNAHSHAFQRVLRGRTEYRTAPLPFRGGLLPARSDGSPALNDSADSFWTWREMMYSAATRLTPDDIYDASRMAFLEMALSGITAVGEFHYLHHAPDSALYDDPNLLAKEVIRAAGDTGVRIALLRVAYARSGFQTEPNLKQTRFDPEIYLKNLEALIDGVGSPSVSEGKPANQALPNGRASDTAWVGVAPHSVRAVPLAYLREVVGFANKRNLKVHMHVAEQPAEVSACVEEYQRTPFALLETEGLLSERFTAVHAIHVTCACPTTERNLGDGVVPADAYFKHGVQICLGTDSQAQIDLLEDARELEYHLRLQKLERAVLSVRSPSVSEGSQPQQALPDGQVSAITARLFDCAARSIGASGGALEPGRPADFFAVDLGDPAIAGATADDLLPSIVFASSRVAVREVIVAGRPIVSEGRHLIQEEVVEKFNELQKRLWG
ncbi:MAG: formimidoylglutamate deiminase [Acidobacteria bacterium]|nr:MAG: formimidoylglutamate deiminase [Acidobacteriota bacterium]